MPRRLFSTSPYAYSAGDFGALPILAILNPYRGSFQQVSVGNDFACGVRAGGSVACWGQRTDGDTMPRSGSSTQVSAGWDFACGANVKYPVGTPFGA